MSRNPTVVALPPFGGLTRRLVLIAVVVYLGSALLGRVAPEGVAWVLDHAMLHPDQAIGKFVTEFVTYPFVDGGLLSVLFACLSLWFFGSTLEGEKGQRWFGEYFFASTIGGGVVASVLSRTILRQFPDLTDTVRASGLWAGVLALIVAFGVLHAEQEITFNFLFRVRAKYLATISMLVYFALSLTSGHRFDALVCFCAGLCGYGYLRLAPRQGLRFLASERLYSVRNAYYRRKRQQAAKKFTVYMKKQGKDVNLDSSGKYVSLEEERRDPKDKRWMN